VEVEDSARQVHFKQEQQGQGGPALLPALEGQAREWLVDLAFVVVPNLTIFSYAQYRSLAGNSAYAYFNYILSVLASAGVVALVAAAGWSAWTGGVWRGDGQEVVPRFRKVFVLGRRVAFGIALGLYPDVGAYALIITAILFVLSIVSFLLFRVYARDYVDIFHIVFESLACLLLVLVTGLFLANTTIPEASRIALCRAILAFAIITILWGLLFTGYLVYLEALDLPRRWQEYFQERPASNIFIIEEPKVIPHI
jgi:hypothetical protein